MKSEKTAKGAQPGDGKVRNKGLWKRFFHLVWLAKIPWIAVILCQGISFGSIMIAVRIPKIQGDFFAGNASVQNVVTIIGCELAMTVLVSVMLFANGVIGGRIDRNFRNAIWKKILHLEPKYFEQVSSNTLLSRITADAEGMKTFILNILVAEIMSVTETAAMITAMARMDSKLVFIMAVFVPIVLAFGFLVGRLKMKVNHLLKFKLAGLTDYLSGQLARITVIKAFNCQEYESGRGEKAIEEYYIAKRRTAIAEFIQYTLKAMIGIFPDVALIVIGANLLRTKQLTVAGWVAFYAYALNIVYFFTSKSDTWVTLKEVQGILNRLSDLFCAPEEGVSKYVGEIVQSGDIQFDDVSFSYGDKEILSRASLTFPKHRFTAIVGPSGTGKTTVLKLLERIYEPDSGRILAGGKELKEIPIRSWRKQISYVKQDTPMISGTIRDNILYGADREVSDEEIMEAAKEVRAEGFIRECPEGLDFEVGQFGEKLSGGQKQKISILRAFLQNREYILLDEPTASLDAVSAYDVIGSVEQLKGKRTVVLVVHDEAFVQNADHIVVIDEDAGVFEGTVSEARKASRFFREMTEKRKEAAE